MIVNRLRPILNDLISLCHNAFVKGGAIYDNILMENEILTTIRRKQKGKAVLEGLKLDMSKAYDIIFWDFIKAVLIKMNFPQHWIQLIMQCVSTVIFLLVLNEGISCKWQLSRSIRQGDPLSPYIFILFQNILSLALLKAQDEGTIKGIRIAKNCSLVNHLLFADDCYFFYQTNVQSCKSVKRLLQFFCLILRQKLNENKSELFLASPVRTKFRGGLQGYCG